MKDKNTLKKTAVSLFRFSLLFAKYEGFAEQLNFELALKTTLIHGLRFLVVVRLVIFLIVMRVPV